ncbi:MAG: hypothetical protein QOE70_5862 [Chthoniobacter sp.]|jgi:hypothetical protein|nr:hypothetical protein [Chthoniobacter sp.]
MLTPTCSKCRRLILADDVNVANDVAFCRACNLAHKLSALVHGSQLEAVDIHRPPPGAWHHNTGLGAVIGATHRSLGTALGALAISLFWNGIVSIFVLLALASTLRHLHVPLPEWFPAPKMNGDEMNVGMTIFLWLFLTPFMLIGSGMIGMFLSALAGRTEVRIDQSEGVVFSGIGPLGWRRRFDARGVKDVRIDDQRWVETDGGRKKTEIVIETLQGKPIRFGTMLREERMKFVAAAARKALVH